MSEFTRILSAIEQGDPHAAAQLLPLVYDELLAIRERLELFGLVCQAIQHAHQKGIETS